MCLNNFRHDLLTVIIAQIFKGSNDLRKKANDMEIHLDKHKKHVKELVRLGPNSSSHCT